MEESLCQGPVVGGDYGHKTWEGKKGQNLHKHSIEVRESLMGDEAAAVSQEVGKKWNVLNQGYVIRFVLGIYQLSQVI